MSPFLTAQVNMDSHRHERKADVICGAIFMSFFGIAYIYGIYYMMKEYRKKRRRTNDMITKSDSVNPFDEVNTLSSFPSNDDILEGRSFAGRDRAKTIITNMSAPIFDNSLSSLNVTDSSFSGMKSDSNIFSRSTDSLCDMPSKLAAMESSNIIHELMAPNGEFSRPSGHMLPSSSKKRNNIMAFSRIDITSSTEVNNILKEIITTTENTFPIPINDASSQNSLVLDLRNCGIATDMVSTLSKALNQANILPITNLNLSMNASMGPVGFRSLGMLLISSKLLVELNISSCGLGDDGALAIASALMENRILKRLDMSNNGIEKFGCYFIAASLGPLELLPPSSKSIGTPSTFTPIRPGNISNISNQSIIQSPSRSRSSKMNNSSDISSAHPSSPDLFLKSGNYNSTLTELNLAGNAIGSQGAQYLAAALAKNFGIKVLDLSYQQTGKKIGPDGATFFADMLRVADSPFIGDSFDERRQKPRLAFLKLARNNIGFEGCRHIASALLVNKSLTELDIGGVNYITITGAMQLAQAISFNRQTRLAWLTVGERRLPIAALIGDRAMRYSRSKRGSKSAERKTSHQMNHSESTSSTSFARQSETVQNPMNAYISENATTSDRSTSTEEKTSTSFVQNPLYEKLDTIENGNGLIINQCDVAEPPESSDNSKSKISYYSHALPITIHPRRIKLLSSNKEETFQKSKEFLRTTAHGMHDEMAVVVATLVQNNYSLQELKIDNSYIPIQKLIGHEPVQYLDFSGMKLTSSDAIVIGSLVAENFKLKKINLVNNEFNNSEGENFIAYALEHNPSLSLDFSKWPVDKMFTDGYRTLASLRGFSASGAVIEPQRLEGWFYQGLTGISGILFYYNLISDILTIQLMSRKSDVYMSEWVAVAIVLLCLPTAIYSYNSMRSLIFYDSYESIKQLGIIVFQLLALKQAYECIKASMESTEMLDYKYVQGVYKSMPQTYIMFSVALHSNEFDGWVLSSVISSLLSITVIFIMLFDRKAARRISMAAVKHQPGCAIWLADIFACTGMGKDNENVEEFVNFNAFYTSHYCWSYVFQILSLSSRVLSITWLLACISSYASVVVFVIFWVRCWLLLLFDDKVSTRSLFTSLVDALSLCISDSAWHKIDEDPIGSRICLVSLCYLSTMENIMAIIFCCFIHGGQGRSKMSHHSDISIFITVIVVTICRWLMLWHWTLHIHFPELYIVSRRKQLSSELSINGSDGSRSSPASVPGNESSKVSQEEEKVIVGWTPLRSKSFYMENDTP